MTEKRQQEVNLRTGRSGEALDAEWLEWFYARVTDQFTLSRQSLHNTHQWVITLAIGLVTAVLTLGSQQSLYPDESGFIAVLVSFPLLFRFFVRSCLECSIQYKWMAIRNALDRFFYVKGSDLETKSVAERHLRDTIELYYFEWKSPLSLGAIVWDNLRLAYLWPFGLLLGLIVWGAVVLTMSPLICVVATVTFLYMIYEVIAFVMYRGFKHAEPTTPLPEVPVQAESRE